MKRGIMLAAVVLCFGMVAFAEAGSLQVGRYFADGMVLQREKPNMIRGVAEPGATVQVAFAGQEKSAKADESGEWAVVLDALAANATPQELAVVSGGDKVVLRGVVVGDVILVALQTSTDISLGQTAEGKLAAAAHKRNSGLRAIMIKTLPAAHPQLDLAEGATSGWGVVEPESAVAMSATAYYLGRDLAAEAKVPVGIVDLNLGSAFAIGWLSREALQSTEKLFGRGDVISHLGRYDKLVAALDEGAPMPKKEILTAETLLSNPMFPAGGYNGVLHPLRGLGLKAAVIQLGNDYPHMIYSELEQASKQFDRDELNRAYVQTYDIRKNGWRMTPVTTPLIPREWRRAFGDVTLPIGLILPPASDLGTLAEHHRETRELHRLTAAELPGVGLILPGMEHLPFSAQPSDAVLVAQRAKAWLDAAVFEKAGTLASGPLFERLEAKDNEATIAFKAGTAKGLKAAKGALDHFEAADVDGVYSPVTAVIDGEVIRISSDVVSRIVYVRYNWSQRPDQGLVNAAGLPAVPFRSQKADYAWFMRHDDNDLPMEYFTPASEWERNEVALISGHLKSHGYGNFTGWVGPVGMLTGPFGPNMGVREVKKGSPADGKILVGDMIYSANGKMLGDKAWEVMAAAVTESETRAGNGKLALGVRRGGRNLDVEIELAVMGTYSGTAPFNCPKTERIVSNLEKWLEAKGAGAGFLNTDALFMLATGNPELQGFVRRVVYEKMRRMDIDKPIDPTNAGKSWHNSADAILFGEYYLATGDRTVLPYLKNVTDRLAATMQPGGGWRHNFPGGASYGYIPNAGLPGVMGMHYAKIAGVDLNMEAFETAVTYFREGKADTGHMIYGMGALQRPVPVPFDPAVMEAGKLSSWNGGLSAAGILMRLTGYPKAAHLCSFISAYAWNNTFDGHGGNFWNNFWTPLGAFDHGREAFLQFWQNHRWYREMNRMYDGSLIIDQGGRSGAGTGIALVAPRQRLQIVGAPASPFAAEIPEWLLPAVAAYRDREYAKSAEMADALLASGSVGVRERPTVESLGRAAREMELSIASDLERMKGWALAGDPAEARTFLPHLRNIMHPADERLAAIEQAIAAARQGVAHVEKAATEDEEDDGKLVTATDMIKAQEAAASDKLEGKGADAVDVKRNWVCLVTEVATGRSKKSFGKVPAEEANVWRMKVVESLSVAPEGWVKAEFDDSGWGTTTLPISWRMYHTVLLRTTFQVEDKSAIDALRFRAWLFRQQAIEIYLNGNLIGRVNNIDGKTGDVEGDFLASSVRYLRNGENTLAVTTRHNWRWGMLSMHVYNDGFGFRLDAHQKD